MRGPLPIKRDVRRIFPFAMKREIMRAHADKDGNVFCACGCGAKIALFDGNNWTALVPFQFNHIIAHGFGGATMPGNGEPVQTKPCHQIISKIQRDAMNKADAQGGRIGQWQLRAADKKPKWAKRRFGQ